jgi:hypothetical protein
MVWLQRNKSLLLLLRKLLLHQYLLLVHILVRCTVPHIRESDLFECLVCWVRIVISARIGRICRVDCIGCDLRAI